MLRCWEGEELIVEIVRYLISVFQHFRISAFSCRMQGEVGFFSAFQNFSIFMQDAGVVFISVFQLFSISAFSVPS